MQESVEDPCNALFSGDFFSLSDGSFEYALAQYASMNVTERLNCASRRLEGTPFVVDPLGEGSAGLVDTDPLFSFEALDCMTYVEEVLALAAGAQDFSGFLAELMDIRYLGGMGTFGARKHFLSADWVPENIQAGRIADITERVGGHAAKHISIPIDRPRWVEARSDLSKAQKEAACYDLSEIGKTGETEASLAYIPSEAFLDTASAHDMVRALPEISVALFVRHQEGASKVGAIVGHMAFLIVPKLADGSRGTPVLRHSSSKSKAVTEEPFLPYLESQQKYRAGITVLEVLDQTAHNTE